MRRGTRTGAGKKNTITGVESLVEYFLNAAYISYAIGNSSGQLTQQTHSYGVRGFLQVSRGVDLFAYEKPIEKEPATLDNSDGYKFPVSLSLPLCLGRVREFALKNSHQHR